MADPSITNDERSAHNATLSWIARGRRGQQRFRTNGFPADDTLHMLAHVIAEREGRAGACGPGHGAEGQPKGP